MVTTFYPPFNFGGDGIAVQRLSQALVRRGHHVTVVHDADAYNALHRGAEPVAQPDPVGVEVQRLRSRLRTFSPLLTQQTGRPVVHGRKIRELLAAGNFDVIHFNNVSLVGVRAFCPRVPESRCTRRTSTGWSVRPMCYGGTDGRPVPGGNVCAAR
jgi:hypothetical protein